MPKADQKVTKDRYQIIPRTLIFIRCGEYFLLIKGDPNKRIWANKYNGIGGHIERGEDVQSAAERELLEETGLSAEIFLKGIVTVDVDDNTGIGIFVFYGVYDEGEIIPSSEGSLVWVNVKELTQYPLVEDVHLFINRLISMKSGDPPFMAHSFYNKANELEVVFKV